MKTALIEEAINAQAACFGQQGEMESRFTFGVLEAEHARQVAKLHIEGISTGFISSLGIDFVTALYEAIAHSETSFGFVTGLIIGNNKVLGFVTFTTNVGKLYKSIVLKKGLRFAFLLVGKMFSVQRAKKVFETLFYPSRVDKMNLPSAELLSIVVAPEARRLKLATQLIQKGFEQCRQMGIDKVKVMVGAANEPANKLYQRCGFELVGQIDSHGVPSNIYVANTGTQEQLSGPPAEQIQQRRHLIKYFAEKLKSAAAVF